MLTPVDYSNLIHRLVAGLSDRGVNERELRLILRPVLGPRLLNELAEAFRNANLENIVREWETDSDIQRLLVELRNSRPTPYVMDKERTTASTEYIDLWMSREWNMQDDHLHILILHLDGNSATQIAELISQSAATIRKKLKEVLDQLAEVVNESVAVGTPSFKPAQLLVTNRKLTRRVVNLLHGADIRTIGGLSLKEPDDLLAITNFGEEGLAEVEAALAIHEERLKPNS